MRAFELHAHAKQVSRSSGRSSVAAAAYRSGGILTDERTGEVHDYSKKGGVEHTRIYLPDNAPQGALDRSKLWNAVERKENRSNSTTAHELEVSFPHEFNAMQRREAGDRIAKELIRRYNVAVDIAYHEPNKSGDERNFHAHILFTTRGFDEATKDGWDKRKFRDLSKDAAKDLEGNPILDEDGKKQTRGQLEILSLREFTADQMNAIAKRDGLPVHTEHLSFEARGIEREPSQKMGFSATDQERRGKRTDRGDMNRQIEASNDNLGHTAAQLEGQKNEVLIWEQAQLAKLDLAIAKEQHSEEDVRELLTSRHVHYPFHEKNIKTAKRELMEAQERLDNLGLIDRMTGKRAIFEQELQGKQQNLQAAELRLQELVTSEDIESYQARDGHTRRTLDNADQIGVKSNAELQAEAEQYRKDQEELNALESALASRSNTDKIIGALTGKTRAQKAKIAELRETARAHETRQIDKEQAQAKTERLRKEHSRKERERKAANDARDEAYRLLLEKAKKDGLTSADEWTLEGLESISRQQAAQFQIDKRGRKTSEQVAEAMAQQRKEEESRNLASDAEYAESARAQKAQEAAQGRKGWFKADDAANDAERPTGWHSGDNSADQDDGLDQ